LGREGSRNAGEIVLKGEEESVKEKIIELLKSTGRDGIDKLIDQMDKINFFEAPCSTQYHLSCEGGLAVHSLNVHDFVKEKLYSLLCTYDDLTTVNWIIVSLLHDIGKASYRGHDQYMHNILKSGAQSKDKPYITNSDRINIPHEIVSLFIIKQFIELTDEEEFAILYHNGLYVPSGRDIQGKERPLQQLLHFSDMWCSRFIEKEGAE
jgi:23S rRNA maturation-related 3'-5' exoribonuclease YhaM